MTSDLEGWGGSLWFQCGYESWWHYGTRRKKKKLDFMVDVWGLLLITY